MKPPSNASTAGPDSVDTASIWDRLVALSQDIPGRAALVSEYHQLSYGELPGHVDRLARRLRRSGIEPGMTLGIRSQSTLPHMLCALAALRLGCSQVTLASFSSAQQNAALCEQLGVDATLAADLAPAEQPESLQLQVDFRPEGASSACRPSGPVIFLATSGTTGQPRAVAWSESAVAAESMRGEAHCQPRDLLLTGIEHTTGKRQRIRRLYQGATCLSSDRSPDTWEEVLDFIERYRADSLTLPVFSMNRFLSQARRKLPASASLFLAGMHFNWPLRQRLLATLTDRLYVRYGATEIGSVSVAGPGQHNQHETVGRPLHGVQVEIVDVNGIVQPAGIPGQVRIRAGGMVTGYWGNDPREHGARFRDGWFYPGDEGRMTNDGELIIHGRTDDVIILNSIKIYPGQIERVFEAHPEVAAAVAFGIKSPGHGSIPAVAVEPAAGCVTNEAGFLAYGRQQLGLHHPRKVLVMQRIPRNSSGKPLRTELEALLAQPAGLPGHTGLSS
jgi:long-chain acyl-CoA synthetase